jgi:beta-N-acetylhexosaminidase
MRGGSGGEMQEKLPIGQMFTVGFLGCEVRSDHWIAEALTRDHLGGILLFERNVDGTLQNIRSPQQLKQLIKSLNHYATDKPFIAVDQEGGKVCRLKEGAGFASSCSAAELAGRGVAATTEAAAVMAAEMADLGITLNFAPVVDLDLNPDNPIIGRFQRSFGPDVATVTAHANAFIAAHHRFGVGCCLKHFPGHGSAGSDSHLGFVDVSASWQAVELEPYRHLLADGYEDGIMTAHLINRQLDPSGAPATLSSLSISGLLRQKLGFTGVVFSDDLQMRAISQGWTYAEAVQQAVLAGVDVLVVGNNLSPRENAVCEGIQAIEGLLDSGLIDTQRIRQSLARIRLFKQKIAGQHPWIRTVPPTAL